MADPAPLQFGAADPGVRHRDRPAAFGVVERGGKLALVKVSKPGQAPWLDLPGGAIEPGESEAQAMEREFGEETGLVARAGEALTWADQYLRTTGGEAVNNRSVIFRAEALSADPALKIEEDHELVWLAPDEAMRRLRHDSHAWGVLCWLRKTAA